MIATPALASPPPSGDRMRWPALDSLRGLAALSVVLCHLLWLSKSDTPLRSIYHAGVGQQASAESWFAGLFAWVRELPLAFFIEGTPLHLFVAGHEAVILFYLLSGFVLYLAYERRQHHAYRAFLTRRVCRLYLPYLAALAIAVGFNATVVSGRIPAMNGWFNQTWYLPVDWNQALQHTLLVGSFNTNLFLMPSWTLVHEMRLSLVFPLLAAVVARGQGRWLLLLMAALSGVGIVLDAMFSSYGNYFITLHYAAFFVAGATIARLRGHFAGTYSSLPRPQRVAFLSAALLLYVYGRAISVVAPLPAAVADLAIAAGAALIILWAISNPPVLNAGPVRWLGKVSYGLYLSHFSLFLASIHLLHEVLPLWAILLIDLPIALVAAELFWRLVEAPAMQLGRRLTSPQPRRDQEIEAPGRPRMPVVPEGGW
jgi:peptidoglycan/LPS O-acetylase OafA/YrhL